MEEGDALLGDQKGLKVDQAMIQDSTNQQQVDEKIIRDAEAKIQAASDRATAARIMISPRTVKRHTLNIYQKLDVNSRQNAVEKGILA